MTILRTAFSALIGILFVSSSLALTQGAASVSPRPALAAGQSSSVSPDDVTWGG